MCRLDKQNQANCEQFSYTAKHEQVNWYNGTTRDAVRVNCSPVFFIVCYDVYLTDVNLAFAWNLFFLKLDETHALTVSHIIA